MGVAGFLLAAKRSELIQEIRPLPKRFYSRILDSVKLSFKKCFVKRERTERPKVKPSESALDKMLEEV